MIQDFNWGVLETAKGHEAFGATAWLTPYIMGHPDELRQIFADLRSLKAENLAGEEGGFLYPKIPVQLDRSDIEAKIEETLAITKPRGLEVSIIDLDSTPDVERSKFVTLWTAE